MDIETGTATSASAVHPSAGRGGGGRGRLRSVARKAGVLATGVGLGAGVLTAGLAGMASATPVIDVQSVPGVGAIPGIDGLPPIEVPEIPLPGGQTLPDALSAAGVPIVDATAGAGGVAEAGGLFGPAPLAAPNFAAPQITPNEGAVVGVAQPIIITFPQPVTDHAAAERAMRVTTDNGVTGAFHWFSDTQVRWRPEHLWPAHTNVTVDTGNVVRHFTIGDAIIATADDATKTITVTRDGEVVRTMPTSMGKPGHETPNGIYTVGERFASMIMDSSTYGVPVDSPEGYRLRVEYATRMSNSGIFIHAAPWSLWAQGNTDTSHGCLNVSPADAKWYFDTAQPGDPVIVVNSNGGQLNGYDGLTSFSMPWGAWVN